MDEIARAELAELRSTAALAGLDMAKLGDNVQLILAGAVERARCHPPSRQPPALAQPSPKPGQKRTVTRMEGHVVQNAALAWAPRTFVLNVCNSYTDRGGTLLEM